MFYFGADYYPEHWDEARWQTDAQLMQAAGFNVVRLAEFAWSLLEPSDGVFDFAWLDRALAVLDQVGIKVVLGTPSASAPPWLWQAVPDVALVDEQGIARAYGSRRDTSPTHPAYRRYAVRVAEKMAEHYKDNPQVIGWQIDNEFGDRCYAPRSSAAFQDWLRAKYGSLERMNAAWGTRFWSHVYTDWSQIPVPLRTATGPHNPGLHLDFYRFMSDVYVDFQQLQVDAIRRIVAPGQFVTHNFMGFRYPNINYFDLAKTLDFVAWDNYPRGFWIFEQEIDPVPLAIAHDMMRSLKKKNFWVMEQQSGQGSWTILPPVPRPGEIALWAYQAVAHGADGIVFFRWRTARHGAEQYWHGILDHDGVPRRRYHEVTAMGQTLRRIGDLISGAQARARVAVLFSYDSSFAFQIQPNNPDFEYRTHIQTYYAALHRTNVAGEFVTPADDLKAYDLVIVPALYVTLPETVSHLRAFAASGGTVVVTARSGVKDADNTVVDAALPGLLASLCGVEVAEYDSLLSGQRRRVRFAQEGAGGQAAVWCDVLELTTASAIARYDEDFYAGSPAVTVNQVGDGQVLYVGTMGDQAFVNSVVKIACAWAGIESPIATPPGVEAATRWQGDQPLLFLLNHTDVEQSVTLHTAYTDLISESAQSGAVTLQPRQVMILSPV